MAMTHPKCKARMKNDKQEMLAQISTTREAEHNCKLVMALQRMNWSCRIRYPMILLLDRCSPNTEKLEDTHTHTHIHTHTHTHTHTHSSPSGGSQFWKWMARFTPIFKY